MNKSAPHIRENHKMTKKPMAKAKKGTMGRLLKTVRSFYPVMMPLTVCCIIFSAVVGAIPSLFMEKVIGVIDTAFKEGIAWNIFGSYQKSSAKIQRTVKYLH